MNLPNLYRNNIYNDIKWIFFNYLIYRFNSDNIYFLKFKPETSSWKSIWILSHSLSNLFKIKWFVIKKKVKKFFFLIKKTHNKHYFFSLSKFIIKEDFPFVFYIPFLFSLSQKKKKSSTKIIVYGIYIFNLISVPLQVIYIH